MIRVSAGVLVRGDDVLVCRRPAHAEHAGKWEFPGGKVEPGETLAEALRRELAEELGVEAAVGEDLWTTTHHYPGREPVELHFFAVAVLAGRIDGAHFAEVRWQPRGRLAELDFLEADRDLVRRLVDQSAGRRNDSSDTAGR